MQAVDDLPVCVKTFRIYERICTDLSKSQQYALSVTILVWRMAHILAVADIDTHDISRAVPVSSPGLSKQVRIATPKNQCLTKLGCLYRLRKIAVTTPKALRSTTVEHQSRASCTIAKSGQPTIEETENPIRRKAISTNPTTWVRCQSEGKPPVTANDFFHVAFCYSLAS